MEKEIEIAQKTCFIIMPISDQDGYDKGHFTRVYQHLIKPACEKAGFKAIRADDEIKTNYIVIDIIKKILDSDIVICDLSAKNPNVMYELGIRQAFNKKSVLIKDNKTGRIFDIQGLRTIDYDENLRIDEVQKNIANIAKTLKETFEYDESENINSLIQLLSIKPAEIKNGQEITLESQLIMDALNGLGNRLERIENNNNLTTPPIQNSTKKYNINGVATEIGESLFDGENYIGNLFEVSENSIFVEKNNFITEISRTSPNYPNIDNMPF